MSNGALPLAPAPNVNSSMTQQCQVVSPFHTTPNPSASLKAQLPPVPCLFPKDCFLLAQQLWTKEQTKELLYHLGNCNYTFSSQV